MGRYDGASQEYDGFYLEDLSCYGCMYSVWTAPPPGKPSGADPCHFCVRNRMWRQQITGMERVDKHPQWPDGSTPHCIPLDAYTTIDMSKQTKVWVKRAEERDSSAVERLLEMRRKLHPEEA